MRRVLCTLLVALLIPSPARADEPAAECISASLAEAGGNCKRTAEQVQEEINTTVSVYRYRSEALCHEPVDETTGECNRPRECANPPGSRITAIQRQPITGGPWEDYGTVCVEEGTEIDHEGRRITTTQVRTEFRRLQWPKANLKIQPVGAETLVNLDTIFYTDSSTPITKQLTLLDQAVTIEATPHAYTWHWTTGDDEATDEDKQPHATTHPGAPFPDQTITHRYTQAGTTVHPRLDITYKGRYRIGNGNWQDIGETRTITGTRQQLTILEARPVLVP